MSHPAIPVLALLFALAGTLFAGEVSLFVGPPGGIGDVVVLDETGTGAGERVLRGVRLLPIDFVGRARILELLPDRPQLREDVPGASRVLLPNAHGSLYRYRHRLEGTPEAIPATAFYGLLHVGSDGRARCLLERLGSGPGGAADPFLDRVAVDATGASILVATTPAAGGDLFEIDLVGGVVVERTASMAPLGIHPGGLALLSGWGAAVGSGGIVRFDRTSPSDQAEVVPIPGGIPAWFGSDVVCSADGRVAAAIAGDGPLLAHVHTFEASGDAVRATPAPSALSGGGFQPATDHGPFLALSDDGSLCAWRTEGLTREVFVGPAKPGPPGTPEHLTSDARYIDTLDETGELLFFGGAVLIFAVGEAGFPDPGIDALDLYRADIAADGTPTLSNVTLTSGDGAVPFQAKGSLSTEDGIWAVPGGLHVLAHLRGGSTEEIVSARIDQSGIQTLLDRVKSVDLARTVDDRVVLSLRRSTVARERELAAVPTTLATPLQILLSLPDGFDFVQPAVDDGGWLGLVATWDLVAGGWLARIRPSTGAVSILTPLPLPLGPVLGFTPNGTLAFSAGAQQAGWTPTGSLVPYGSSGGHPLPGI